MTTTTTPLGVGDIVRLPDLPFDTEWEAVGISEAGVQFSPLSDEVGVVTEGGKVADDGTVLADRWHAFVHAVDLDALQIVRRFGD